MESRSELPEEWRRVKSLRGLAMNEALIAELLGVSRGRVSQLLTKALRKLRRRLENAPDKQLT